MTGDPYAALPPAETTMRRILMSWACAILVAVTIALVVLRVG